MDNQLLYGFLLTAVPILLSLTVHEFAHARTALAFGDRTAQSMGRCTLNPLAHLHPVGTIMMFLVGVGWAKPVPVMHINLNPRRLGSISTSLAGPASNAMLAAACIVALRLMVMFGVTIGAGQFRPVEIVTFLLFFTSIINLNLALFNLIPLFPLDGHHIGREILPGHLQGDYMRWQVQYGMWIFLALWIGPNVLHQATGLDFDPLGWYLDRLLWPALEHSLGPGGWGLAIDALVRFAETIYWF